MKKRTWYRLDNAAKIYPPTSNSRRSGVFTLSAVLNEEIDKDVLNDAVNVVLNRFPLFKVKLKRGVFWYYLEENKKPFYVAQEPPFFLQFINEEESNDYLFRVFYFNNKITLAIFHALTDGTGGMEVLKAIVFEYLILKGYKIKADNELKTIYSPYSNNETVDDFLRVYNKKTPKQPKALPAFKITGTPFNNFGVGVITAKISIEDVKKIAKDYDTTITGLFSGLLVKIIYDNHVKNKKLKNKNVRVLVPVNLRKIYQSDTMRNFAMFSRPGIDFVNNEENVDLKTCIEVCSKQIKEGSTKEVIDTIIASNVKTEKNWLLKIAPLFLKDIAMQIGYSKLGDTLHTTSLSNLGLVSLPEGVKKHVKEFVFALGASYSSRFSMAVIGYESFLNLTFTRDFVETTIEREFIRFFTSQGVEVEVKSNYWEDNLWKSALNAK